jgi:ribokinase
MKVHAVVVGSLVMDLAFAIPRRPEAGEEVLATSFGAFRGGKGYNEAVALARLGAHVTLIGAVGADLHGDGFIEALHREGVDASRVVQLRGAPTAVAAPLITPDGKAAFVHFQGANCRLSPAHCADLPDCDVVLLQGEVSSTTSTYVTNSYRRRGTPVHLRPSPVEDITAEMLTGASVITPSPTEAAVLCEADADTPLAELAGRLARSDLRVAISLASGGTVWAADGETGEIAAARGSVVDSTASRDSFVAALAVRLAEGAHFSEAATFAAAAGRHAAGISGAEPSLPSRAAVDELLSAS